MSEEARSTIEYIKQYARAMFVAIDSEGNAFPDEYAGRAASALIESAFQALSQEMGEDAAAFSIWEDVKGKTFTLVARHHRIESDDDIPENEKTSVEEVMSFLVRRMTNTLVIKPPKV